MQSKYVYSEVSPVRLSGVYSQESIINCPILPKSQHSHAGAQVWLPCILQGSPGELLLCLHVLGSAPDAPSLH